MTAAPGTVGPPNVNPGDPDGVIVDDPGNSGLVAPHDPPVAVVGMAGRVGRHRTWDGQVASLAETAWMCIDLNSNVLSTMPPYLVGAAPSLGGEIGSTNPDPDIYTSWEEFAKQLFWDYQMGEASSSSRPPGTRRGGRRGSMWCRRSW